MTSQQKVIRRTPRHMVYIDYSFTNSNGTDVVLNSVHPLAGECPAMDDLIDVEFDSLKKLSKATVARMRETPEDIFKRIGMLPSGMAKVMNAFDAILSDPDAPKPKVTPRAAINHGQLTVSIRHNGTELSIVLAPDDWMYHLVQ